MIKGGLQRLGVLKGQFQQTNSLNQTIKQYKTTYKNYFKHSGYMIPHPDKAHKGGEDAKTHNEKLLCVCDGVGGWARHGVDPGLYSKQLVKNIEYNFENTRDQYIEHPKKLMIESHLINDSVQGSTTCCIITLNDSNEENLKTTYIGDSGYVIYRKQQDSFKTIFVSEEQQKSFNFPYQIGHEKQGSKYVPFGDHPNLAQEINHTVLDNDVIVVGTDGIFDNIDAEQILNCIKPFWDKGDEISDLDIVAQIICQYAYKLSLDPVYNSPFSKKARQSYIDFPGGKSDDITLCIAQVKIQE